MRLRKNQVVVLNGKRMRTRERAHTHLARRLHLPSWYGRNLDALCDCLGEINVPTVILLRHARLLKESLGDYGAKLISVLAAMTGENPNLSLIVHQKYFK
jgi:ribonuclease inhibitor